MNIRFLSLQACIAVMLCFGTSCDLAKQASKIANLINCQYKVENVANLQLAGVPIQGKSSLSQLGAAEIARLASAFIGGQMPLSLTVNMGVKNTSSSPAGFTAVKYILALDGEQINTGSINNNFTVNANSTNMLPISTTVDLKQAFAGKSKDALINLALQLAGQSNKPTMIGLKIKPSFLVNGQNYEWPDYFQVKTEYASAK